MSEDARLAEIKRDLFAVKVVVFLLFLGVLSLVLKAFL